MDIEAVKKALWEHWDPIGVRQMGGPSDEYDSYAPVILQMLKAGATEREVATHLYSIAVDQMGLEGPEHAAARALIKLKGS